GVQVAESTERALVARLREEIEGSVAKVPIVQEHPAGEEAEVDFGEFQAVIAGVVMTLWMFAGAPVIFGQGGAYCIFEPGAGVGAGWACASVCALGRGTDEDDPVRQPQTCGDPRCTGSRAVRYLELHRDVFPLHVRFLLLYPGRTGPTRRAGWR